MATVLCSVFGCDRPAGTRVDSNGLCGAHNLRYHRTGVWPTTPLASKRRGAICDVPGCGRKHEAKGLCHSHYAELKRTGVRPTQPIVQRTTAERFWAMVEQGGADDCWFWRGATDGEGRYGAFGIAGRLVRAHRWSYEHVHGPLAELVVLDHLCRTTLCVNPAHLEPVTQRENILRGVSPQAANAHKTHCKYGHPFSGDNLIIRPDGNRDCRECARRRGRERTRRYRDRQRRRTA